MSTKLRHLLLALTLLAFPSMVFAHRLDEYLQATLVSIEPDGVRLQINLTPGVDVADKVIALIDLNHDGAISTNEVTAYAGMLRTNLTLRLDRRELALKLAALEFPSLAELRTGEGIIQLEFSASLGALTAGTHKVAFENRHRRALSVYLVNAAQPKAASVRISRQKRNKNQSSGEIEFAFRPSIECRVFGD